MRTATNNGRAHKFFITVQRNCPANFAKIKHGVKKYKLARERLRREGLSKIPLDASKYPPPHIRTTSIIDS